MKIREIRERYTILSDLAAKKLPIKLAYAVSRNLELLQAEVTRSEEKRIELCKEYANVDQDGNPQMVDSVVDGQQVSGFQIDPERAEDFVAQLNELFDLDVAVSPMTVDSAVLDQLESDRYDPLTPAQIGGIGWMIDEG